MSEKQEFQCLLCNYHSIKNREDAEEPYRLIQNGTRDSKHQVVQCKNCGHIQLFPLPTVNEDEEYYNKNIHDKSTTPSLDINGIFEKFKYQNEQRINYVQKYIDIKGKKLLDYASGYGFFLQMLYEGIGVSADGLEISQERLDICSKRLNLNKEMGQYVGEHFCIYDINLLKEELPESLSEKYNIVTMFHLLEHIIEPVIFLKKVKGLLNENGVLVVELPNYNNIMMSASEEFKRFFFIRDHISYYTPDRLRYVLEQAGFEIEILKGIQLYGLENHMNWLINKRPQYLSPSYEISSPQHRWLEKLYKDHLDDTLQSEYMFAIAHVSSNKS